MDRKQGDLVCNRLLDMIRDYDEREFIRVLHQAGEYLGLYDILNSKVK